MTFRNKEIRILNRKNNPDTPTTDEEGILYIKYVSGSPELFYLTKDGGSIQLTTLGSVASVNGTGTDNTISRWDGTSNIQDSGITVDDSNNTSGFTSISIGSTTSDIGALRLDNGALITSRDFNNVDNLSLIGTTSNNVKVGDVSFSTGLLLDAPSSWPVSIRHSAVITHLFYNNRYELNGPTEISPSNETTTATGYEFTIHGQDNTTTGSAGNLVLRPGFSTSGTDGYLYLDDGSSNSRLIVDHSGNITLNGYDDLIIQTEGNVVINTNSSDAGAGNDGNLILFDNENINAQSMQSGIFIGNSTSVPTGDPTSGIFVYAEGGAGKARGSSGTVTTWAPADPHCPKCGRDTALEWKNEQQGWELSICMWCVTDAINNIGVITKEQK
jgi:hypothetical protein